MLKSVPDSDEAGHARDLETFAVVLYFDKATERRVRQIWAALDLNGVPSVASSHGVGYRPHLTLAIIEAPFRWMALGYLRLASAVSRAQEYSVGAGIMIGSRLLTGAGYMLKVPAIDLAEALLTIVTRGGPIAIRPAQP